MYTKAEKPKENKNQTLIAVKGKPTSENHDNCTLCSESQSTIFQKKERTTSFTLQANIDKSVRQMIQARFVSQMQKSEESKKLLQNSCTNKGQRRFSNSVKQYFKNYQPDENKDRVSIFQHPLTPSYIKAVNNTIQRESITIDTTKYTQKKNVEDIVKQWKNYQDDGDLYLLQLLFDQDRVFTNQDAFLAEIVKLRPGLVLTEGYWKRKAISDGGDVYSKSQTTKFWNNYSGSAGTKKDVSQIITDTGKELLNKLDSADKKSGQLRLYRGMKKDEGLAIVRWFYNQRVETEKKLKEKTLTQEALQDSSHTNKVGIMPIKNHLGGIEQAGGYGQESDEVVMEFTLKSGAHEIMFNPNYMAVAPAGKDATSALAAHLESKGKTLPTGSKNEGALAGRIGIKSEKKGPFSLSLGESGASRLLFQLLVESIRIIKGSLM
jgi:hypothetical protein